MPRSSSIQLVPAAWVAVNLTFKPCLARPSSCPASLHACQPARPASPAIRNPVGAAAIPVQALSSLDHPNVPDTQMRPPLSTGV